MFITPNLCDDGHDGDGTGTAGNTCVNGAPGGLTSINAFVKKWVAIIQASPAYQKDGLIIINFDESNDFVYAGTTTTNGMTTYRYDMPGASCCNQQTGPNVVRPDDAFFQLDATDQFQIHYVVVGGDRVGAIMLSRFIAPGTVSNTPYNHYSMLKSLEDIFKTNGYLGYADDSNLVAFGNDIFTNLKW